MGLLLVEQKIVGTVKIENILHDSSNVLKTSFNYDTKQLYVTFKNGKVYYYNAIPFETYEKLKLAESSGKYLNAEIIRKFTTVKVGEASKDEIGLIVEKINKLRKEEK